jgi:phosphonate degradation associated HDIG domain protein
VSISEEVFEVFARRGSSAYGESISMTEHALQAAYFARADGAPRALVLAALLHDVGHLVSEVPDDLEDWIADAHHEEIGGRWLARRFPPEVFEPVRLHVPAKRFLCATDAHYVSALSPASVVTLKLQGGPMSAEEVARFEAEPYCGEAVKVRRWDDLGKIAGLATPGLEDYRALIHAMAYTP